MTPQEIADAVNKIIRYAHKQSFKDQAINWGAVCVNAVKKVHYVWPQDEDEIHEVELDEVSPDSHKFFNYIEDKFKTKYGFYVAITGSW